VLAEPDSTYAAIAGLLFTYAERLDDGDLDGVAELFAHATFRSVGADGISTLTGSAQIRAAFAGSVRMHDGVPATQHVTSNLVVEHVAPGERAVARSLFTVLQATPNLSLQVVAAGRYRDEFIRTADGWRFADRLVEIRMIGDVSEHLFAASIPTK
jgi:3-phenylpropionate/cinnamic acid dioxygenase small subunit